MLIETGIGEFSDAQALTNGSTASTNVINLAVARQQLGANGQLWLWLRTNVAVTWTGAESYIFTFEVDTVENFASPKAVVVVADSDGTAIVEADPEAAALTTAGKIIYCSTLPYGADEQYGRWLYTLADGGGTAGITVDAGLSTVRPPSDRTKDQVYQTNVTTP